MKKNMFVIASMLAVFSLSLSAQTTGEESTSTTTSSSTGSEPIKSKRGFVIVPQKGDKALGIDATPFLGYVGNLFVSDTYNSAPSFGFTAQKPGLIYAKYMVSESVAYRVAVRIGLSNTKEHEAFGGDTKDNIYSTSAAALGLFGGYEMSPIMKSRLRAFYGPGAQIGYNPYVGNVPTYGNVTGKFKYTNGEDSDANDIQKGGGTTYIGVGGFVGLEFFILPKISIGGEFNVMLNYSMTSERIDAPAVGDESVLEGKSSAIMFDNMASGSLVLMCYF